MNVRSKFLEFFASKGHQVYESMPLVPEDNSLLFTNAGMVQFKDVFIGKIPCPNIPRATSSQLCMRAGGKHNDLENVGYTARHHTLFEMLGNFSFGDYFKQEAISYAWEFVTQILGFSPEVLYISVHQEDTEAYEIWKQYVPENRIKKMGDKDNFWQMGDTGPCGPCSEIFVDQGEEYFGGEEDYFGGEGDRFLEIWNLVFMQYERSGDGTLTPLPKPSIDTGMGLERVVALLEGKRSNFDSSIFMPLIAKVVSLCGKPYVYANGASYRVIADHARSVAFLLAQGVHFDKEGRGYVLRRILRRAVRHGYLLGIKKPFLFEVVKEVCVNMEEVYPYLREKQDLIMEQCKNEEQRFFETLESGMRLFYKELEEVRGSLKKVFSGEVAFKLYDTYGFPLDLTSDMLREESIVLDLEGFEACMQKQRELAKASWKGSGDESVGGELGKVAKEDQESFARENVFLTQSALKLAFDENFKVISKLQKGQMAWVMLEKNPFYAQGGGAIGDRGWLKLEERVLANVLDVRHYFGKEICKLEVLEEFGLEEEVLAVVDEAFQLEVRKHHSATHLLHAVLREVLGEQVSQAGSLVEDCRLRFDFSYPKALRYEEIEVIERRVNALIAECLPSKIEEMGLQEAKQKGAMALFGEKYGESVRVVSFGEVSCELCGGLHVDNTGKIGNFYILKESGVSSGVRRIEAICGNAGYLYVKKQIQEMDLLKTELKTQDLFAWVKKNQEQIKQLKSELKTSLSQSQDLEVQEKNGIAFVIAQVKGDAKEIVDRFKNKFEKIAILLVSQNGEKISITAGVKNAPLQAGKWVKEVAQILGGSGGGRDDFATAGGKDASKVNEALSYAKQFLYQAIER